MSLPAGRNLGPYEILSPLGAGGMGEVYRARDKKLDRFVAVKVISERLAGDPSALARFEREAKAVAALSHPNILAIHDFGSEGSVTYAVMELLEGETLRERLVKGPLPPSRAQDMALQIASGLAAAHEKGIVHRDLKPGNVFLTKAGHVKVLDFGLARLAPQGILAAEHLSEVATEDAPTHPGAVVGTVGYMAPEQARGQQADARSDIFSFGVVLYEMLSGVKPFDRGSAMDTLAAILKEDPPPLPPVTPPGLDRVVRRCLEKRPQDRFSSAHDVAFALEAVSGSGTGVSAPSLPGMLTGAKSRWVVVAGALGAVFLLTAVVFGIFYFTRGKREKALPFQNVKVSRLTRDGMAGKEAAVSPDGRYVAYLVYTDASRVGSSLWVQQVATSSIVQLIPPSDGMLMELAFSPDGNYVYYMAEKPVYGLYRVPVLGGPPERVNTEDINTPPSFSPDGQRIVYLNIDSENRSHLFVCNIDGTGKKELLADNDKIVIAARDGHPDWSPDGSAIAFTGGSPKEPWYCLELLDVKTGQYRSLGEKRWEKAEAVEWLPDGRGLLVIALDRNLAPEPQIWFVAYPSGEARPLTNDVGGYTTVGVSGDGKSLVSVRAEPKANLWVAPSGDPAKAVQVTRGYDSCDGRDGLAWTPAGGLVYTSKAGGTPDLWLLDKPGDPASQPRRITHDAFREYYPSVSPDGRTVVCLINHPGTGFSIWRMDADGSNPKQISPGPNDFTFVITADGRSVVYHDADRVRPMRVPIAGGTPEALGGGDPAKAKLYDRFVHEALSSDGRMLGGWFWSEKGPFLPSVIPLDASRPRTDLHSTTDSFLGWAAFAPDGKGLLWVRPRGSDVWRSGLDGSPPRRLTDIQKSEVVFKLSVSRDGKQLAFSRGQDAMDVVLIQQTGGEEEKN